MDAVICSIWTRGDAQEADRLRYFERTRCNGRVQVNALGMEHNVTFHTLPRGGGMSDRSERAILAQTRQTYLELREKFPEAEKTIGDGESPSFGESFILDGFSCRDVCIGDVFKVAGSTLTLQVSSPRHACSRVDRKHPMNSQLPSGSLGTLRHFVNGTGCGGIFFRVMTPGRAGDGDRLALVRRPHPKWTLDRVASIVTPIEASSCLRPTWNGSDEELDELCELKELACWEWKDVFRALKEKGVKSVNVHSLSGNGTLENVGVRVTGNHLCPDCNQRFDTEMDQILHWKFVHDSETHQQPIEDTVLH
mmetsp:Transcript_69655/g.108944  ORF Transcript_69655/g.108944 Transcript_69655/m.108944 type:complete len:308 (-) Transcript_69655:133-1056(-)